MGRILCIDFGERRTGVAVSDITRTIAQGLPTIEHKDEQHLLRALRKIMGEQEVDQVVFGLPLGRGDKPSRRSEQIRSFAGQLRRATGLVVEFQNERLSTVRAKGVLEQTYFEAERKQYHWPRVSHGAPRHRRALDRIAATIILEDYLAEKCKGQSGKD
jgi:putative holliday junction resolvase